MRFRWINSYWTNLLIAMSLIVLSLWLAIQGKLALYIHPRYIWFTVILCSLALLCIIAELASRKTLPKLTVPVRAASIVASTVCLVFCFVLIILRPSGLTSSAARQRGINTAALTVSTNTSLADLSSAQVDYTQFSIKEWAALLSQTNDSALFTGKAAMITGFVSPTPDNNPNVFYVSRFIMTCCAVDARPIGVPVYRPGWQKEYKADRWVAVQGIFRQNPENGSNIIVLEPQSITPVDEPKEPYAY